MKTTWLITGLAAVVVVGCVAPQGMETRFTVRKQATMAGVDMQHSRMIVTVIREGVTAGDRQAQKLPTTFDNVDLTLSNTASLLQANKTSNNVVVGPSATQATSVFSALRPGSGYKLAAVVQNSTTTVGSGYADGITLVAGQTKIVTIVIGVHGDITVSTSGNGNTFGSGSPWVMVKGDSITFTTGFNAAEANVSRMDIIINGSLYSTANNKIDEKTSNYNTYQFVSGTNITNGASGSYTASLLTASTGNTVTFRLKNSSGNTIGESVLSPLTVEDPSAITLQLQ